MNAARRVIKTCKEMTSIRTVNNSRGCRLPGGQIELCLPWRCSPSVWRRGNISDERGRRRAERKIGIVYKGKRQRMHRKQGRVAAAVVEVVVGRPVFYANLIVWGESHTYTHSHISIFAGSFIIQLLFRTLAIPTNYWPLLKPNPCYNLKIMSLPPTVL